MARTALEIGKDIDNLKRARGSGARRVEFGSGATRHAGVLANSSWAARSRAAAPSPNTRTDIDSTIAASRKRKPGSMDAISAFAAELGRPFEPWGTR